MDSIEIHALGLPGVNEEGERILDDLRLVGPRKPLGYLPISTLVEVCGVDPETTVKMLHQNGLKTITLSEGESRVESGALYVYHEEALGALLHDREQILIDAGWPTEPEPFVRHLNIFAGLKTDLFDLVADAFGDKGNPGRKNV